MVMKCSFGLLLDLKVRTLLMLSNKKQINVWYVIIARARVRVLLKLFTATIFRI
jgi:hypothetical protein